MTHELALEIFNQVRVTKCADLWEEVVKCAIRYAQIRVDWLRAETAQQQWIGIERSTCHNALINACNTLASQMVDAGESADWRRQLGTDRKVIGDFACHLYCILGILAR